MRPWATPPTRESRFLCTAARPGTQGSRTDGWGEIDGLVPRVNTRAARAVAALAALHRCLIAAHSPDGLPDRCAADPTHPPAQSAHRAGTPPARFPIPRPWHRARPTCARRHVRSTFNLSTCRCASFCTWATGPVHGSIGWACFLGCQPFVGEMTSKSVRQPRMRHHGKAAQPMVRRGHGLPAGAPGAPRALPWRRMADQVVGAAGMKRGCVVRPSLA